MDIGLLEVYQTKNHVKPTLDLYGNSRFWQAVMDGECITFFVVNWNYFWNLCYTLPMKSQIDSQG